MTQAKIKSLDEIAEELRAVGELDEEALKKIKGNMRKLIMLEKFFYSVWIIAMLIEYKSLTSIAVFLAIIYGFYRLFSFLKQQIATNIYATNYGIETDGFIDSFQRRFLAPSFINIIGYYFYDSKNFKHRGEWDISMKNMKKIKDIVKVRYIAENPNINVIAIAGKENSYNLKKPYVD